MESIKKIYRIIKLIFKINWIKTLYINFKTQKFAIAVKLPIIVVGKLKIYSLKGEIVLNFKPKFGTVIIGKDFDHFPNSLLPVKILINNKIVFHGPTIISGGTTLTSWNGVIEIGKYTSIGSGNVIKSQKSIKIGNYSRIVSNCVIMDTNVHFVLDNHTKEIQNIFGSILIGKYCWINAGTTISKGSVLPDYSITGRNSLINRDYSVHNSGGLLLVGAPSVIKAKNIQKIFNYQNESKLKEYFLSNPLTTSVNLDFITTNTHYNEDDSDFESFYKLY